MTKLIGVLAILATMNIPSACAMHSVGASPEEPPPVPPKKAKN